MMTPDATNPRGSSMVLIPLEREFLIELASLAVAASARQEELPDGRLLARKKGLALEPRLLAKRGVFVTLKAGSRLRGCIGYIDGHRPLLDAVVDNARSAAVADPRFDPVTPGELAAIDLEISALTPLEAVSDPEEIEIGSHGIVLEAGGRRAVFLPQVAVEQGWDLPTTLGHLALKAGLAPHAWQEGASLQVFTAEVF